MELQEARKELTLSLRNLLNLIDKKIIERQKRKILAFQRFDERMREAEAVGRRQDKLKRDYIKKFNLTKSQIDDLHMFFSPLVIPEALTHEQILLAIELSEVIYPEGMMTKGSRLYKILKEVFLTKRAKKKNDPVVFECAGAILSNEDEKVIPKTIYEKKFNLRKKEVTHLRLFFTPMKIPKGLTEKQVFLFINLARNMYHDHLLIKDSIFSNHLEWVFIKKAEIDAHMEGMEAFLEAATKTEKGRKLIRSAVDIGREMNEKGLMRRVNREQN